LEEKGNCKATALFSSEKRQTSKVQRKLKKKKGLTHAKEEVGKVWAQGRKGGGGIDSMVLGLQKSGHGRFRGSEWRGGLIVGSWGKKGGVAFSVEGRQPGNLTKDLQSNVTKDSLIGKLVERETTSPEKGKTKTGKKRGKKKRRGRIYKQDNKNKVSAERRRKPRLQRCDISNLRKWARKG